MPRQLPIGAVVVLIAVLPVRADDGQVPPSGHEGGAVGPYVPVPRHLAARTASPPRLRGEFVSVQVNVDDDGMNIVGDAANEPSIAVDPRNSIRMAIGWRQFDTIESNFRQAGWGYTIDAGRAWTFPGVIEPGVFRSDPVLDADADGHFYYNSLATDGGWHCDVFKSHDAGRTWGDGVYAYGGDKQWMAIDRTGGIGHGNIYAAWDHAGCCEDDWFNRSTDGAQSFEPPVPVPERPIWGVTAVGPEGEVCIVGRRRATNEEFVMAKSTTVRDPDAPLEFDFASPVDLGGEHRFATGEGPNPGGLNGQVWIAFDHSDGPFRGHVYVLCSVEPFAGGDPLDVHFVRSTDGGLTWSDPVRVNDDPRGNGAWQWFGTMSVAPTGRIDVVFNDTRNDAGGFDSELFYTYSDDGGVTWSPNVAVSPPFDPHLGWPEQDKLGDYYDMVSDRVGADVAYAATFNGEQDVYYLRLGDHDCNDNGVGDAQDIEGGTSGDANDNGIPDECECLADIDGSGAVGFEDLLAVLAAWGEGGGAEDIDGDGVVDFEDLLALLAAWGPCP